MAEEEKPPEVGTRHGHIDLDIDEEKHEVSLHGFKGFSDALMIADFILKKFRRFLKDPNILKLCSWFWVCRKSGKLDLEYTIHIHFDPLRERDFLSFLHEFGKNRFLNLPVSTVTQKEKRMMRGLALRLCFGKFNGSSICHTCKLQDDCYKTTQDRKSQKRS